MKADVSADDERVYLIDESLEFRFGSLDGDATCAWKDLSGDDGDLWEFVSSKVSQVCSGCGSRLIPDRAQAHQQLVRDDPPELHL